MAIVGGAAVAGGIAAVGSNIASSRASRAAKEAASAQSAANAYAAELQAEAQRESLYYMKGLDELPRYMREGALTQLGSLYGANGEIGGQQRMIDKVKRSPLYDSIMGTRDYGEDAIMRNASATGGLRSGNVQQNLYEYNQRLANDALLQSYDREVAGLAGLTDLPSLGPSIADNIAGIGATNASGVLGASNAETAGYLSSEQARQQNIQNIGNIASDVAGTYFNSLSPNTNDTAGTTAVGPGLAGESDVWNYNPQYTGNY